MSARPKTTFMGATNPFTGAPKTLKKNGTPRKPRAVVTADTVTLCTDPMLGRKSVYTSKYDALFAKMGNKSALRCESAQVAGLSKALIIWAKKRYGALCGVRTTKSYPGDPGHGRVWLLLKEGGAK